MENNTFKRSYKVDHYNHLGLAIFNCGIQRCEANYSWGPALRDHFLIHYIRSGKGVYKTDHKQYSLSAGDGFISAPSTRIFYCADPEDPWEYIWVGFNGPEAERMMKFTNFSNENPIFHCNPEGPISELFSELVNAVGSRPSDEIRMHGKLMELMAILIETFGNNSSAQGTSSAAKRYIDKALQFIQYNYSRDISVGDIADSIGISRSHLYRLFMDVVLMSPNEYLTTFRINESCTLLREQGLSVSETAYSTGFSDQLYFSRVFKKYKGIPPSKYAARKKHS